MLVVLFGWFACLHHFLWLCCLFWFFRFGCFSGFVSGVKLNLLLSAWTWKRCIFLKSNFDGNVIYFFGNQSLVISAVKRGLDFSISNHSHGNGGKQRG